MMFDFKEKLVLVTGAGRGVGKVIAKRFAQSGAHVLINFFHSLEEAKRTKSELEAMGAKVDLIRGSVAMHAQVEKMFEEIRTKYGYLDVLVNNAASGALVPYEQITDEYLDRAFNTNLKGSFWCSRLAAPLMSTRGGGSIINLSTLGGERLVMANYLACGVAKAAVEALTRYLANEFAAQNIRVVTAAAGMLESTVANQFPDADAMQQVVRKSTPMGRLGSAEEFADVILFLASDRARWITGQTVLADGGLSLGSALLSPAKPVIEPVAESRAPETSTELEPAPDEEDDIAIVGMGLTVPGASNPDEYWKILMEGAEDAFRNVPPDRWDNSNFFSPNRSAEDKTYSEKSAFITDPTAMLELDRTPGQGSMEYSTLWLRHALLQALEGVKRRDGDRFSFSVGYTADGSQHLEEAMVLSGALHHLDAALEQVSLPVTEREKLRTRTTETLQNRYVRGCGPSLNFLPHRVGANAMKGVLPPETELQMVDTACSSSLYAMDIGIKGLQTGQHDVAICGGSFALGPRGSILFAKLNGLSAKGEVRALDREGDGVLFADGAGVIVLKRLSRALTDGDRILGLAMTFGASSDGKGKAIYAPSSSGQELAIRRAFKDPSLSPAEVDWVVAHATGTPAGDLAEFKTLREVFSMRKPVYVTSNKSVIGHTGWAAGAMSVIQVLLALKHGVIPPQHRFTTPPSDFLDGKGNLVIPVQPVPWRAQVGKIRSASVSGFGFGGTNAHLLVREYVPGQKASRPAKKRARERIALVAWSCHLPGVDSPEDLKALITEVGKPILPTFGDIYPIPPFQKVRLPPSTVRTIDRSQLMILECAHQLRIQLGSFWENNKEGTGVLLGHMGATRNATLYSVRCYLDDIWKALNRNPTLAGSQTLESVFQEFKSAVKRLVPPSNEDSFPGSMPNVIPARIANYFGLNGLNMTLDTGFSSALTAFEIACRYLQSGELEMALVGGINGNVTPEMCHLLAQLPAAKNAIWSEGALLFALVRESTAKEAGLTVLAWVGDGARANSLTAPSECSDRRVVCGLVDSSVRRPNYLGAEGMLDVLKAVLYPMAETRVVCQQEDGAVSVLTLTAPMDPGKNAAPPPPAVDLPEQFRNDKEWAPGKPLAIARHVLEYREVQLTPIGEGMEFFPTGSLILTDRPKLLEGVDLGRGSIVLSTEPMETQLPGFFHVQALTTGMVERLLKEANIPSPHIRVVSHLSLSTAAKHCLLKEPESLVRLHTLVFLILKASFSQLQAGQGSFLGLFLDAFPNGHLHPHAGLFGGLAKCVALELPRIQDFVLFSSETLIHAGVRQVHAESRGQRHLPVVLYQAGVRKVPAIDAKVGVLAGGSRIGPDSVIVAVGGARGITAEILKSVSQHFRPRIHIIGSNDLDAHPDWVYAGSDADFQEKKAGFIRARKQSSPDRPVAAFISEFSRMAEARCSRKNLEEMERRCGKDRVRYHSCSILDREGLERLIRSIVEQEGKVDLLINAAGLNKSAPISSKSLQDFLSIRDIKLKGYHNLKWAFRDLPPRLWCNFGSLLGLTGQVGESDYAAANDFLSTAALFVSNTGDQEEFTLGWTLWGTVGLGANELTKAYFEKSGTYSNMCTEEGIHHFIREIHVDSRDASVVHLGEAEKKAIKRLIPSFIEDTVPGAAGNAVQVSQRGRFYLDEPQRLPEGEVLFQRQFSQDRDAYLLHHRVNGFPTLPGTFLTEIAAEAAAFLVPHLKVIGFEDLVFHRFLRVFEGGNSNKKRILARVLEQTAGHAVVQVKVLTDVFAPNGTLLVKDKLHFEIKALASTESPPAPLWGEWAAEGEEAVLDPYHMPQAPVLLTGPFVSTSAPRCHSMGKRAESCICLGPTDSVFGSFLVPSLLLDGLARVGVLGAAHGDYLPLAAPSSIRRIDLYEPGNDLEIWKAHGPLRLYATPRTFNMAADKVDNRLVAVRADNRLVLQIKDIAATVIGYMHRSKGTFHPPAEIEGAARAKSTSKQTALA